MRKTFLKNLEHFEQTKLFDWAIWKGQEIPELNLLFSVPNGGKRNITTAIKLKREGVKAGVPDVFFPVAKNGFHGMFLEMKVGKNKPTDLQKNWHKKLADQNFLVKICYSFEEARDEILKYLGF